jgi:DNA-binding CsgD family transcriptional regulator
MALLFHNLLSAGRTDEARAALGEIATAVGHSHDAQAQFVLELAEAGLAYADCQFDRALLLVEAAIHKSNVVGDDSRANLARQWRCEVLTQLDRLDESMQITSDSIVAAERNRQAWALHAFESARARQLLHVGRLSDAAAILEERFSPETAYDVVGTTDAAGVVVMGKVALHRGDPAQMTMAGDIARVMLNQAGPSVRNHAIWLLALQAMADGDAARALEWLCADGADKRMSIAPLSPIDVTDDVQLVHIALAVEDDELVDRACESASHRAQLNPAVPSVVAAAAHTRGLAHRILADISRAIELLEDGLRPLALAAALEDFAVLSVEDGHTDEAVEAFGRALETFAETGANWDAGRIRGRLRSLGVRRRLVTAQRPRSGWESITESELAVVRLVAQGLSNRDAAERLFVSRHTINAHLRSIFLKLDINSRVELARMASLRGFDAQEPT